MASLNPLIISFQDENGTAFLFFVLVDITFHSINMTFKIHFKLGGIWVGLCARGYRSVPLELHLKWLCAVAYEC